jgi:GST-like protein
VGKHPLQLYSLGTPNGVKVTVMLEELLALGHSGAEYDAWLIRINEGEQFGSGFVAVNPNSKIPALLDRSGPPAGAGVRVRRHPDVPGREVRRLFAHRAGAARAECLSWLFWQMGSAPFPGRRLRALLCLRAGQDRVRDRPLCDGGQAPAGRAGPPPGRDEYLAGDEYTIADMAIWPWYGALAKGLLYEAGEFLQVHEYTHVLRWAEQIASARRCSAAAWSTACGRPGQPVARAARRQRLRHQDAGQESPLPFE